MRALAKYLKPDRVYKSMRAVPFAELNSMGYKFAFLDLDNTIAIDHVQSPSAYTHEIIDLLKDSGFTCCIVSNAKSSRSSDFSKEIHIPCVSYANKPSPSGIFRAMEQMGAKKENSVFFGDQIFTDIVAAKRAGILAVLVEPLTKKEVFYVKIKRPLERLVRFFYHF